MTEACNKFNWLERAKKKSLPVTGKAYESK